MHRRTFFRSLAAASATTALRPPRALAAIPKNKITRVRVYAPPEPNPLFNQSDLVVTIETDAGITGIGEGGSKDMLEQCAGRLIGQDPQYIERLWQDMSRSFFYPPGREKEDALGALDLALWDIKGKVLELARPRRCWAAWCATTANATTPPASFPESSPAWASRSAPSSPSRRAIAPSAWAPPTRPPTPPTTRTSASTSSMTIASQAREGVGKNGDWCVDFHQRFDLADAVRGCSLIEDLAPFFVEDPVRTEAFQEDLPILRRKAKVPIAAGEEWGNRWDFNKLVENHDIDYVRATLPNVGGITEMMKIAAICETHFVGIVPHFTGPIATAALVNSLGTFSGPVLMEYNFQGQHPSPSARLPRFQRTASSIPTSARASASNWISSSCSQIAEITERITNRAQTYFRPDGSITNW